MLNSNLLMGTADKLQENLMNPKTKKKRTDVNINISRVLENACFEIDANYKAYLESSERIPASAPITEAF